METDPSDSDVSSKDLAAELSMMRLSSVQIEIALLPARARKRKL